MMENQNKKKITILVEIDGEQMEVTMSGGANVPDVVKACCCVVDSFAGALADEMGIGKKVAFAGLSRVIAEYSKNKHNNKED